MSEVKLPEGWCYARVGDYLYLKNGFAFKSTSYVNASEHTYPVIRISDLNGTHASDRNAVHVSAGESGFEINNGDLLIAMSGATTGKIGVYSGRTPAYQNQRVGNITLHSTKYGNAKYRDFLISSLSDTILKIAYGGAQPNISGKAIEQIKILLPPLTEQKIIADKLDDLLARMESIKTRLENIPEILKKFRQSVLSAAVSGKLTEEWRIGKNISINSWCQAKASDVCLKVQSGSTPSGDPFNQKGTIPFLKVYNIVNQEINFTYKPQFIKDDIHSTKCKRSIAYPNDVLMNIVGPPLGKVAILTDQYPEWNVNQAITLFRANEEKLFSQYLYYVLCEGNLVRTVMPDTKGIVGQVNISLTQCRDAIIPCPSLEEQREIIHKVENLFNLNEVIRKQIDAALVRINNLTQSILAKAFRGELTAQWREENPELISGLNSAEALLEKITAEKLAAGTVKKRAKKTSR
ncbi:TPA: restriction endonuclease subunit S [Klebsiella pneumoniae]|nr:restriction endonuclease subunit S [Klebsiella pneumoniae]HCT9938333.1 restriction endonuclease subunit S [Klebsiella variicola]QZZ99436.1 restriction endonuclease subunit S [Klebsiella pneumoniae]HBV3076959.1 restriction endonuclease subunit S [Klebsiella pneumoniae]HBV3324005.1 restriction endonuclease subunit S [Klebsiella pneumoniae]HDK7113643.1 restriction endonuclease subunit S [Klebsiella variicola]